MISDIFEAVRTGKLDTVSKVLDERPELIDVRNPDSRDENSPHWDEVNLLHTAAKNGHLDLVKELVKRGADVYSNPTCSYPAVMVAAWEGNDDIVNYFLNEIPEKAEGTCGVGVTCNLAGRKGWLKQVQMHVERDPLAVHQRGWIGDTPLHWPSHNGFIEIVELLLKNGADPNAHVLHWLGGTPLHWASERNPQIVEMLILAGSDVNSWVNLEGSSMLGATPLIWCAKQRDDCSEAAEMLLKHGADPAVRDHEGMTALDHAKREKNKAILKSLKATSA
jgi:ankyrin repeat protein